jgi:dipeptidyl-peptidase III
MAHGRNKTTPRGTDDRPYLLERVGEAAVVQLYADGFAALPLDQKILIWHLYQAALAGRDIFWDQRYEHNLLIRDVLEEILTHAGGIDDVTLAEIERYTKLFWLNTGPYNNLTARKFVLECTPERSRVRAAAAGNGRRPVPARARRDPRRPDREARSRFSSTPTSTRSSQARRPGEGTRHPRLERQQPLRRRHDGRPRGLRGALPAQLAAGEAGRAARRGGLPGRRGVRRRDPARSSGTSRPRSRTRRRRWPRRCARSSGSTDRRGRADRVAYDIAWVHDKDSPVDTINGFVEVYMDARGIKGAWEALVYYVNRRRPRASGGWPPRRSGSRTACRGPPSTASPASAASPPTPSTSSSRAASRVRSRRSASTCRTTRRSASTTAASRCRCRT